MLKIIKWLFGWNTRNINRKECEELVCFIDRAGKASSKQQIIEYDKIYHHTLKKLGYQGTFGEILKNKPKEISDLNEIWELHKLRNSLVHELKNRDEKILTSKAKKYREVTGKFIKQVTK